MSTSSAREDATGALTWLFVPGDRPDRFPGAIASGADAVILDLEDAVAFVDKKRARGWIAAFLATERAWVRVNGVGTPWFDADMRTLATADLLAGIVLPKTSDPADVRRVADVAPDVPVIGLVETARAVTRVAEIAESGLVCRLAFGSVDLAADIGVSETSPTLDAARASIVFASRAAGLPAPIAGVTREFRSVERLHADATRDRACGFGGKLLVHPLQCSVVEACFAPTEDEVTRARKVLAASNGGGVAVVDGHMVDAPVCTWARSTLRAWERRNNPRTRAEA